MPDPAPSSMPVAGARQLASTTKSAPQMRGCSPRWLVRMLPWVETEAGVYRVNRRLRYDIAPGRVGVSESGGVHAAIPAELGGFHLLRGFEDLGLLTALAGLFVAQEYEVGETIFAEGAAMNQLLIFAHGRAVELGVGAFGEPVALRTVGEGVGFGAQLLTHLEGPWTHTLEALTNCVVLRAPKDALWALIDGAPALAAYIEQRAALADLPQDKFHQGQLPLHAGHEGEPELASSYVDYETAPAEYELSVAQTILRVHTRVGDLYNEPHDQLEQQLRLTIEALRERQELELINNPEFGLLASATHDQRMYARPGPPSPEDFDELICRRKQTNMLLAHPRTIAAFARECTRRGLTTKHTELRGQRVMTWRDIPLLPCDKIPISATHTSSVLCLRTGAQREGIIGLHQPGLPDEIEPSLNLRFMGIDDRAARSYLVSLYYSLAVLVPDALGVLTGVELRG